MKQLRGVLTVGATAITNVSIKLQETAEGWSGKIIVSTKDAKLLSESDGLPGTLKLSDGREGRIGMIASGSEGTSFFGVGPLE